MSGERDFRREVFASIYLMMLGIIQASVFAYLLTETLAYVTATYLVASAHPTVGEIFSDLRLLRSVATLAAIALITFEYAYFVTVLYRAITVRDIVLLFLIGIIEFAMASQTANGLNWWVMNVVFSIGGVLALVHTATFNMREVFEGNEVRIRVARLHNLREMAIVVASGLFALWVAVQVHSQSLGFWDEVFLTCVWFGGCGTIMFWNGSIYIKEVTR